MARSRRTRRRPRPALLLLILGAFAAGLIWFAIGIPGARSDLVDASVSAQRLQQAIADGNKEAATASLTRLQASARSAHSTTNGIAWRFASLLPVYGDDVKAVRTVSESLDELSARVLPSLVGLSTRLDPQQFSPHDGKLDLAALAVLADPIDRANSALRANRLRVDQIDADKLNGLIKDPIAAFQQKLDRASDATTITHNVLELAPTMLGAKDRTYLIVIQNNAEVRSTGGIPGAYLLANVDRGRITLGDQGVGRNLKGKVPGITLTAEEKDLYSTRMKSYFLDTNFTPDFPRTAQIMKAIVKKKLDVDIDGVVSVDPIAMSYFLRGTGPVKLPDGSGVSADNAVAQLLNTSYLRYQDPAANDRFFEDTAAALFTFVTDGHGDTGQTIRGIVRAAQEQRILLWSAHSAEQQQLRSMSVAAALARGSALQPTLGVYLNDSVGAKLQYYLETDTTVTSLACQRMGAQKIEARVDLSSRVPRNAADLPFSILGTSKYFGGPGLMRMNLRFYLPVGGALESVHLGTTELPATTRTHDGHLVATIPIRLEPGAKTNVRVVFSTANGQSNTIAVAATPGVRAGTHVTVSKSRCPTT